MVFNIVPTAFEVALGGGTLAYKSGLHSLTFHCPQFYGVQRGAHCFRGGARGGHPGFQVRPPLPYFPLPCSSMVFNVVPTAFEVALVAGILAYKCGPAFAGLTAGTIVAYTAFTFSITQVCVGVGLGWGMAGRWGGHHCRLHGRHILNTGLLTILYHVGSE